MMIEEQAEENSQTTTDIEYAKREQEAKEKTLKKEDKKKASEKDH